MSTGAISESGSLGRGTGLVTPGKGSVSIDNFDDSTAMVMLKDGSIESTTVDIIEKPSDIELFNVTTAAGLSFNMSDSTRVLLADETPAGPSQLSIGTMLFPILIDDGGFLATPFGATSEESVSEQYARSVVSKRYAATVRRIIDSKITGINPSVLNAFSAGSDGNPGRVSSWVDMTKLAKAGAFDFVIEVKSIGEKESSSVVIPQGSGLIIGQEKSQVFSVIR